MPVHPSILARHCSVVSLPAIPFFRGCDSFVSGWRFYPDGELGKISPPSQTWLAGIVEENVPARALNVSLLRGSCTTSEIREMLGTAPAFALAHVAAILQLFLEAAPESAYAAYTLLLEPSGAANLFFCEGKVVNLAENVEDPMVWVPTVGDPDDSTIWRPGTRVFTYGD